MLMLSSLLAVLVSAEKPTLMLDSFALGSPPSGPMDFFAPRFMVEEETKNRCSLRHFNTPSLVRPTILGCSSFLHRLSPSVSVNSK